MSFPGIIFAEELETYKNTTKANIECLAGTEPNGKGTQCVLSCSDGTIFVEKTSSCKVVSSDSWMTDTMFLMLGIVIAAIATAAGLILTWKDRRDAAKQRNQEIVQTYSTELREISNQEILIHDLNQNNFQTKENNIVNNPHIFDNFSLKIPNNFCHGI